MPIPPHPRRSITLNVLRTKCFIYDSAAADERYFKAQLVEFAKGNNEGKTLTAFIMHAVWVRNGNGQTLKYCFFNDRMQRVFIDRNFFEWVKMMLTEIENELKRVTPQT